MIKDQYKPYLIVFSLFGLHFLSGYPGGMSPDTLSQYHQSLNFYFISGNPPVMAMLWSVLNFIHKGPETMLFVHLMLLWGGVLFLYIASPENKYRKWFLILPFIPNILSQSTTIWKDVGFAFTFFFLISACAYYTCTKTKITTLKFLALLIVSFYGMAIKFQAQFIIIFLIYWIISLTFQKSLKFRLALAAIISFLMISVNLYIINMYSINDKWWQLRAVFDIAGISMQTGNDNLFPDYIKNDDEYDYEKLKANFRSKSVDYIFFIKEGRIFTHTLDENKLKELNAAFLNAIIQHPFYYLYHRLSVFSYTLKSCYFYRYAFLDNLDAEKFGIQKYEFKRLKVLFTAYITTFPRFLAANAISFVMILFFTFQLYSKRNYSSEPEYNILKYICLISMGHTLVILFTVMSSDYRYYYIVRVLSFMAIPIYLNLRYKAKEQI